MDFLDANGLKSLRGYRSGDELDGGFTVASCQRDLHKRLTAPVVATPKPPWPKLPKHSKPGDARDHERTHERFDESHLSPLLSGRRRTSTKSAMPANRSPGDHS